MDIFFERADSIPRNLLPNTLAPPLVQVSFDEGVAAAYPFLR